MWDFGFLWVGFSFETWAFTSFWRLFAFMEKWHLSHNISFLGPLLCCEYTAYWVDRKGITILHSLQRWITRVVCGNKSSWIKEALGVCVHCSLDALLLTFPSTKLGIFLILLQAVSELSGFTIYDDAVNIFSQSFKTCFSLGWRDSGKEAWALFQKIWMANL